MRYSEQTLLTRQTTDQVSNDDDDDGDCGDGNNDKYKHDDEHDDADVLMLSRIVNMVTNMMLVIMIRNTMIT